MRKLISNMSELLNLCMSAMIKKIDGIISTTGSVAVCRSALQSVVSVIKEREYLDELDERQRAVAILASYEPDENGGTGVAGEIIKKLVSAEIDKMIVDSNGTIVLSIYSTSKK